MTKAEAKRYVRRVLAAEARHHLSNGSEWLYFDHDCERGEFSPADTERIEHAVEEVATELARHGKEPAP